MNPLCKQDVEFLTCNTHAFTQIFSIDRNNSKCKLFITGHAKMMVLALITSMISFASANPLTLAKLAKTKWTLAVLTTAPMEQLVPRPPTSGTTFALVLLDLLADFAMKTSTNVLSQLPAATAVNVSIRPEVTHANATLVSVTYLIETNVEILTNVPEIWTIVR